MSFTEQVAYKRNTPISRRSCKASWVKRIVLTNAILVCFMVTTAIAQNSASAASNQLVKDHARPPELTWPPRNDANLRKQVSIPEGKPLLFRDAHGGRLSEEAFLAALPSAGGFAMNGTDGPVVQLTLQAPNAPLPKKRPFQVNRGDLMPPLAGTTIDGKPFGSRDFLGRTTLVNFLYAGCTYCIEEVPVLNQFAAENPSIQTVAITYDDPVMMRDFVEKWHFSWPVVAGEVDYVEKLGLWVYPSLAVVDSKGRLLGYGTSGDIHQKHQALTSADIKAWIARVSGGGEVLPRENASATGDTAH